MQPNRPFEIEREALSDRLRLRLAGSFTVHDPVSNLSTEAGSLDAFRELHIDGGGIEKWDSRLVLQLLDLRKTCEAKGIAFQCENVPPALENLLQLSPSTPQSTASPTRAPKKSRLTRLGEAGLNALSGIGHFVLFMGETTLSLGRLVRGKAVFQRRDLWSLFWESSGRAFPIVFLISFLTGLIMAFVGAIQLTQFGADIFVADLVAIAMFREMGAMMTAIIIAGRTGSAFAAQIGSMKANDELNALQTMGISSFDFIVMPRLTALALMMPVLAFLASLSGMLGGLMVTSGFMDVTVSQYMHQSADSLNMGSFASGILKSVVFGGIVAIVGCYKGMRAGASAEAVGQAATSSVVTSITCIIIADALFAVLFHIYGI